LQATHLIEAVDVLHQQLPVLQAIFSVTDMGIEAIQFASWITAETVIWHD